MAEKVWGRCFNYESPIKILTLDNTVNSLIETTAKSIAKDTDEMIYSMVLAVGVDVSKEELEKALRYDREQYKKGYADGLKNADVVQGEWVPMDFYPADFKCSLCGGLACKNDTDDDHDVLTDYCPHCGAMMDGE